MFVLVVVNFHLHLKQIISILFLFLF